jgi:ribosomal protein S27E
MVDEGEEEEELQSNSKGRFTEFTCPECSAYNPMDDGFKAGEEVRCSYCGELFDVRSRSSGRVYLRLK